MTRGSRFLQAVQTHRPKALPLLLGALCLLRIGAPTQAASLLVWTETVLPAKVDAWKAPATGPDWATLIWGGDTPDVKRALAAGRLPRPLLRPRDATDLALLGRALHADWVLLPGDPATLVSSRTLQAAMLPANADPDAGGRALRETLASMDVRQPTAAQWETVAARWLTLGQPQPAFDVLDQARNLDPDRVTTQALQVDAWRLLGDLKQARQLARLALNLHPGVARLMRASGELALAEGNPKAAIEAFTAALADAGPSPALHRLLGEAYLADKRERAAEEEFKLAGNELGVAARLAAFSARRSDWSAVARSAEQALEETPDDWGTRLLLAQAMSATGRYGDAVNDRAAVLIAAADADSSGHPVAFGVIRDAIRSQLADTLNAMRGAQTQRTGLSALHAAAQQSVIAADRIRSAARGRPEWDEEKATGKRRVLALSLWSQGAYELVKALEANDMAALTDTGDLLRDALTQWEAAGPGAR